MHRSVASTLLQRDVRRRRRLRQRRRLERGRHELRRRVGDLLRRGLGIHARAAGAVSGRDAVAGRGGEIGPATRVASRECDARSDSSCFCTAGEIAAPPPAVRGRASAAADALVRSRKRFAVEGRGRLAGGSWDTECAVARSAGGGLGGSGGQRASWYSAGMPRRGGDGKL